MAVPWNAGVVRPDPTVLRPPPRPDAPAGLRRCVPADLRLEAAHTLTDDSVDGCLRSKLRFRSVATTDCAISNARLAVRLVDTAGATLATGPSSSGPAPTPATLRIRPGQLIFGELLWSLDTGCVTQPAHVAIYPGGDTGDTVDAVIISVADLAVPARRQRAATPLDGQISSCWYVDRVADPGALATVTATMTTPATVGTAEILRYSIILTNSTLEAVPLSPCPDFAQLLLVKARGANPDGGSRGPLNCRAAPPTISPGASVTFAFEYDTADHPPGHGKLIWRLFSGSTLATSVQGNVIVTP